LNESDLAEFVTMQQTKAENENAWSVAVADINKATWDLTSNNPNRKDTAEIRTPTEILAEIEQLDVDAAEAIAAIRELL
jgi:type I restriction enzyme M protein